MMNNGGSVVQKPFEWVQLTINQRIPSLRELILATLFPIPHLTPDRSRIERSHISPNLSIPYKQNQKIKHFAGNSGKKETIIPVIHEIHMEEGEKEAARAICSGCMEVTRLARRGSSIGTSSLPRRREGSKRRVTGVNGPSRVVGTSFDSRIEKEETRRRSRSFARDMLDEMPRRFAWSRGICCARGNVTSKFWGRVSETKAPFWPVS